MARTIKPIPLRPTKYGVTEAKKAELDALNNQMLTAQIAVEQLQAVVDSLQDKSNRFTADMNSAEQARDKALANLKSINQLAKQAHSLLENSEIAFDEVVLADAKIRKLSIHVNEVMNKLIYTSEMINKLSNLIVRRKALNPLISDELVTMISQAGSDANNAVALTLVALESVFTSQATSMEAEAVSALEYTEAMKLYETMTGTDIEGKISKYHQNCLQHLIKVSHTKSVKDYEKAKKAERQVEDQLNEAKTKLTKAQVRLNSLKTGYAAANAAAFAS